MDETTPTTPTDPTAPAEVAPEDDATVEPTKQDPETSKEPASA